MCACNACIPRQLASVLLVSVLIAQKRKSTHTRTIEILLHDGLELDVHAESRAHGIQAAAPGHLGRDLVELVEIALGEAGRRPVPIARVGGAAGGPPYGHAAAADAGAPLDAPPRDLALPLDAGDLAVRDDADLVAGQVHEHPQAAGEDGARVGDAGRVVRHEAGELEVGVVRHVVEVLEADGGGLAEGDDAERLAGPEARGVPQPVERGFVSLLAHVVVAVAEPDIADFEALVAPGPQRVFVEAVALSRDEELPRAAREAGRQEALLVVVRAAVAREDDGVAPARVVAAAGERRVDEIGEVDFHFYLVVPFSPFSPVGWMSASLSVYRDCYCCCDAEYLATSRTNR